MFFRVTLRKWGKPRRVDEDVPTTTRNIDNELPRPIGIYGRNVHHSVFRNNTFVGMATPIYLEGNENILINNRAYYPRRLNNAK